VDVNLIVGQGLCSNIYVIGRQNVILVDTGVGNFMNPVWPQLEHLSIHSQNIKGIVLTHAHHDHAMGTFKILERASPEVYIHKLETRYIATHIGSSLVKLEDGDIIETERWPLEVIWTPGHTEGSICLYSPIDKILFSGDTVFPNGYFGRYDGESGSLKALMESLRTLKELDVDLMLPGHGFPVFKEASRHLRLSYINASA
jgi:glyoxylase-like metal-dependent hydrolase (beta-lactamase superfamily II)